MLQKIIFLFRTSGIVIYESFKYFINKDYNKYIISIANKLSKNNIFYVKIFQSISTDTNILNEELIEYFSNYTDKVEYDESEINNSYLSTIKDVYEEDNNLNITNISKDPINSGLISLVYTGYLDNQKVVIKVIRNGIREKLKQSLDNVSALISVLSLLKVFKFIDIKKIFDENYDALLRQSDFINEMKSIVEFYNTNKNLDYIVVPKVYNTYTLKNSEMIVMDFIEGKTLEEVEQDDKDEYCYLLAKFGLKNILFDRLYHADLHRGNIFFLNNMESGKQLGIIDYGITGSITKEQQNDFYNFFTTIDSSNYCLMSESFINNLIEPKEILDNLPVGKKSKLIDNVKNIIEKSISIKKTIGPNELYYISYELYNYKLRIKDSFCKIQLSLAIADSVSKKLCSKTSYTENITTAVKELFPGVLDDYDNYIMI